MNHPKITVIMPIRGAAPFLRVSIDSILYQSIPIHELIVIDDGMDVSVQDLLDDYSNHGLSIKVIVGEQCGPAAARNLGIRAAQGELLSFLDDDDVWPKEKLEIQTRYLLRHPEKQAVTGRIRWFNDWDENLKPDLKFDDLSIVHVNLGAYLVRRDLFDAVGLLDNQLMFSEDVDFILRLIDGNHSFSILNQDMLLYRRHPASMTAQKLDREKIDYRKVLFASLKRRKKESKLNLESFLVEIDE